MEMEIREATPSDLFNLAVLKQQVWISTYASDGLMDVYSKYVLSEYSAQAVQQSIADPSKLTLLALQKDCLLGCVVIQLTPMSPTNGFKPGIEISTLYILEKFQKQGIGTKLMDASIDQIKRLNHNMIWLTVYHQNQNAIDFYRRQNFKQIGETDFLLGEEKHKNYILIKNI